jgi:hypothetical protein
LFSENDNIGYWIVPPEIFYSSINNKKFLDKEMKFFLRKR